MQQGAANFLVVVFSAIAAVAAPSSGPATRNTALADPPPATEQADALKLIRSIYQEDYSSHAPNEYRVFARKLLRQGLDTKDHPAARYVLLRQAAEISSNAGDAATAMRAIDALAGSFNIDAVSAKGDALQSASRSCVTTAAFETVTRCSLAAIDQALAADQYDQAVRVEAIAQNAASHSKNLELIKEAHGRNNDLAVLHSQFESAKRALDAVHGGADDGASNLAAGRFLCFIKGDWDAGLPLLARGADETIQTLAQQDLANPADPATAARLGDGWWERGEKEPAVIRKHLQSRAEKWYRKAMPNLSGLTKDAVQHRLDELDAIRLREMHLSPGLLAEIFEGQDLKRKRTQRFDPTIDFSWGKGGLGDGLPKSNYSIRWSGQLKAPSDGIYSCILVATTGARFILDDKSLIDNPALSHKRNGERVTLRLPAGLHSIKIEFWTGTGDAKAHLLWIPPGATQEQVVPAEAFYHDTSEN